MADALSKELGLDKPIQQHGAAANDHVQEEAPQHGDNEPDSIRDKEIFDSEKHYERPRISADSYGLQRTTSGVDVEQAQKDFAELNREFSALSRRISRTHSRASNVRGKDVEKAVSSSDETSEEAFDLENTLRGAREADDAAGIKSKYIGQYQRRLY